MEAARGQSASDNHVDGNALAGAFAELFTTDITVATTECAQCGCIGPVACLVVYADAPGYVARCQECGGVVLKLVRTPETARIDLRGTVTLTMRLPDM
ncbi:DUF6510 family protein (plasmid) [Streptomyces sp. NBC_01497]